MCRLCGPLTPANLDGGGCVGELQAEGAQEDSGGPRRREEAVEAIDGGHCGHVVKLASRLVLQEVRQGTWGRGGQG